DFERREEAIVDAVLERVDKNRLAEVGVGVDVILPFGRCRQPQLHGGCEIFEDAAPTAFVVRATTMAFIDGDEVEEVWWILAKVRGRMSFFWGAAHERLK